MRTEMRVRGQGGQGAITFGYVVGRAASMYQNTEAILTEAYGPEVTGGFARADVVFDDDEINYPLVTKPTIAVIFSTEAWLAEKDYIAEDAIVIYETRLCKIEKEEGDKRKYYGVPALHMALELKAKVVMNVVLMAVLQEVTNIVSKEALQSALLDRIPERFKELNLNALKAGYEYAKSNFGNGGN